MSLKNLVFCTSVFLLEEGKLCEGKKVMSRSASVTSSGDFKSDLCMRQRYMCSCPYCACTPAQHSTHPPLRWPFRQGGQKQWGEQELGKFGKGPKHLGFSRLGRLEVQIATTKAPSPHPPPQTLNQPPHPPPPARAINQPLQKLLTWRRSRRFLGTSFPILSEVGLVSDKDPGNQERTESTRCSVVCQYEPLLHGLCTPSSPCCSNCCSQ